MDQLSDTHGSALNQQVTSYELGWLAGILDGEGHIGISRNPGNPKYGYNHMRPVVDVGMTSAVGVLKIQDILRRMGIEAWVKEKKPGNKKHKTAYAVIISAYAKVKPLLELVSPYLVVKKAQATLVLDYINRRQSKIAAQGGKRWGIGEPDEEEMAIVHQLRGLNRKGPEGTSETTRATPVLTG